MRILILNSSDPRRWGGSEIWMRRALALLAELGHEPLGLARPGSPALAPGRSREWDGGGPGLRRELTSFRPELSVAVQHRDLRLLWLLRGEAVGARVMARHLAPAGSSWKRRFYYSALCDALWVPSEYMKAEAVRVDRVPARKVHVLRPSVPSAAARPDPGSGATVLCVGRLSPEKGQEVLLQARARMRSPARLVVVGQGRDSARLRALAQNLGLEAWVDWVDYAEDLGSCFERAHVVAQPSYRESFGLAALEAMSRGVAVVASRTGGLPEVAGEGEWLVPPGDASRLAGALDLALLDADVRLRWAAHAQERARRLFTPELERAAFQSALQGSVR